MRCCFPAERCAGKGSVSVFGFPQTHLTASHPLRHSPPVQVEQHSYDRTTDDGQDQFCGRDEPNSSLETSKSSGLSKSPA